MNGPAEQRHTPRVDVSSSVSVFQQNDLSYLGLLLNCSDNGLMISTYEPIPPGTELSLELVDIRPDLDLHRTGFCQAEVVWSRPLTPSLYRAGCRIKAPCTTLDNMIRSYQTTTSKPMGS
ncbi:MULTISPECIES: PilZ domain-containing protein [unclassified Oceanobacter]|uniref:PilZ domain-containing protein n=1 Tax=unclassified Oceanobacter TaxID=2620260 RepID=UPI0026E250F4|nr:MULTISPECIES: PilZ domain-containing protein [unclassified Oceanobacter]MDO6681758.1 PilZ domain-containing protein [Oceanobacter sp. 5_MG-2023]MDP2609705.1 PilZ domain-containing protein [Oceanobacter sp. 1_MG-2023]MDP2613858.1 PilZ domain-containing protein [Oceanobacter sp. 2_MG-2023]